MDILRRQGETNQDIAVRLGITEGAVRYQLKRLANDAKDGRAKLSRIEQLQLVEVVDHWWNSQLELLAKDRSPNVKEFWTFLSDEYRYNGTYPQSIASITSRQVSLMEVAFGARSTKLTRPMHAPWAFTSIRIRFVSLSRRERLNVVLASSSHSTFAESLHPSRSCSTLPTRPCSAKLSSASVRSLAIVFMRHGSRNEDCSGHCLR